MTDTFKYSGYLLSLISVLETLLKTFYLKNYCQSDIYWLLISNHGMTLSKIHFWSFKSRGKSNEMGEFLREKCWIPFHYSSIIGAKLVLWVGKWPSRIPRDEMGLGRDLPSVSHHMIPFLSVFTNKVCLNMICIKLGKLFQNGQLYYCNYGTRVIVA